MGALNATVHVYGGEGEYKAFGPGDDVPEWAAVQMGAHCFEDGKHPFPNSEYPGKEDAPKTNRRSTKSTGQ